MGRMLTADLGPNGIGWAARVNGSMVCVAAPRVLTDPAAAGHMRELVRRQGGDCYSCCGCPLGRLAS